MCKVKMMKTNFTKRFYAIGVFLCFLFLGSVYDLAEAGMEDFFLNSTTLISYDNFSGTGFLVSKEIENGKGYVLLITNKHVLPPAKEKKSILVRVTTGNNVVESIEIPVVNESGEYLPYVKLHPEKDTDVAALNITEFINANDIKGSWIPEYIFGTKEKLRSENITVGDDVFLLGYPDAIFDPRNVYPIARQGIIATVPFEGYVFNDKLRKKWGLPSEIDGFLIDANVFPGSSGSLVIFKPQAAFVGAQGQTVITTAKKRPYLLGIVAMSIPIVDEGSFQRMGLGVVFSVENIQEIIEKFY